jgi:hypothetical protein
VRRAIDFYDKFSFSADEVSEEATDWFLTNELKATELPVAQF